MNKVMEDATEAIAKEYMCAVRSCAEDVKDGNDIDEVIDGSEWVIYTFRARLVLAVSDNANAWQDEGVEIDIKNCDSQRAYYAMRADVTRLVECSK